MPVIGLTGGIATGKSLVTDYLERKGIPVVDADRIARNIVRKGEPALVEVVSEFGSGILHPDGTLNRERLGERIFGDSGERKRLEAILHPRVYDRAWEEIRGIRKADRHALVIFSVPLLFESGHEKEVDRVIVVYADEATQLRRIMKRDGLSERAARKRIAAQLPIEEKRKRADFVIRNTGAREEAYLQVEALLPGLRSC